MIQEKKYYQSIFISSFLVALIYRNKLLQLYIILFMISATKPALQQAGIRLLQSNNSYNNKNIQQSQQQISFARNFKLRLLNVDPEQEKNREMMRQNYKRDLEKQMQEQRIKKQQQKKKQNQQDLKQEKAFYEKMKIEASQPPKKQQPAFLIMRTAQRNRLANEKKVTTLEKEQPYYKNSQMKKIIQNNYHNVANKQQSKQQIKQFPNLMMQIKQYRRVLDPYQNERFQKILQDQQSMIRKMEDLKIQIRHSSSVLQTDRELQKIRNILRSRSINLASSNISNGNVNQNQFLDLKNNSYVRSIFEDNKSLQVSTKFERMEGHSEMRFQIDDKKNNLGLNKNFLKQKLKTQSENNSQEQYDKVDMLELSSQKKQNNKRFVSSSSFINSFAKTNTPKNKIKVESANEQMTNKKVDNMLNHLDNMIEYYQKS